MNSRKCDNHNLGAKLALRRYLLDKYHAGKRVKVFDCCEGGMAIWSALRQEYDIEHMGVDLKKKRGRLTMDSARILEVPGWNWDMIDVDVYGSPWLHWMHILHNGRVALTVVLTVAEVLMGGGNMPTHVAKELNLPNLLPYGLRGKLQKQLVAIMLGKAPALGWIVEECVEADNSGSARYIGVRISRE